MGCSRCWLPRQVPSRLPLWQGSSGGIGSRRCHGCDPHALCLMTVAKECTDAEEPTLDSVRMQFVWAVMPRIAQVRWVSRDGLWLLDWLALIVTDSERCALIVALTLLGRLCPHADHTLRTSTWPRLALLWAMHGVQSALIDVVTWIKVRADAAMLEAEVQHHERGDQRCAKFDAPE